MTVKAGDTKNGTELFVGGAFTQAPPSHMRNSQDGVEMASFGSKKPLVLICFGHVSFT